MKNDIRQLIQLAQAGDSEAFHQLVVLHDEKIMTLAFQLTQNKTDAEDLYQEVFIKAYKSISKFRFQSAFYTWLYRITVNTFYNLKRSQNKMPIQEVLEDGSDHLLNISEEPNDFPERNEIFYWTSIKTDPSFILTSKVFTFKTELATAQAVSTSNSHK